MISYAAASVRLFVFLLWTAIALPPYLVLVAAGYRRYPAYCSAYWRVVVKLLGFQVVVRGTPVAEGPALLVANHASYLDVVVLGALVPTVFVAKAEVAGWPVFGYLARIAKTAFIDRRPNAAARERDRLGSRIDEGVLLLLFPEGTSNDGNLVLPFKSSFFAVAERPTADGRALPVQPVSVAYTRVDGFPMGRALRPFFAWYGDMTLFGHLVGALGLGRPTVEVQFHPPVTVGDFGGSRKALCNHCHDVVRYGVTAALAGRLPAA
ncbi:MAG: 1-acyl-sn-glycerol-3-phosphate acyltransferase [Magnetospirillum sp.]|nr:1-acyl-sn-glycerol-3-phosphate acyltransferase [Magnetospirillum sp.]